MQMILCQMVPSDDNIFQIWAIQCSMLLLKYDPMAKQLQLRKHKTDVESEMCWFKCLQHCSMNDPLLNFYNSMIALLISTFSFCIIEKILLLKPKVCSKSATNSSKLCLSMCSIMSVQSQNWHLSTDNRTLVLFHFIFVFLFEFQTLKC